MSLYTRPFLLAALLFCFLGISCAGKVKVFVLAGQSNMVGMGSIKHLDMLVQNTTSEYYHALINETNTGNYKTSDRVHIRYFDAHGMLTVGPTTGFAPRNNFGPELMIGNTLEEAGIADDGPILLIKTAWGGRSLAFDFLPPSSRDLEEVRDGFNHTSHPGWLYDSMVENIRDTLQHLDTYVHGATDYELSGFVWFQGWNDVTRQSRVKAYQKNLENLLHDVRRDLSAENLPFVIGELGMHGSFKTEKGKGPSRAVAIRKAQKAVVQLPEFADSSIFVPTASYVVPHGKKYNTFYHYNGRADTIFHIGQALGRGLLQVLSVPARTTPEQTPERSMFHMHPSIRPVRR